MPILNLLPALTADIATNVINRVDAGPGPGIIEFYTGAIPATPAVAVTSQTKLGTLTCSDPSATYAPGAITFNAIAQDNAADASGTATWARVRDSTGGAVLDMDVTDTNGTGTIRLNTVAIVAGGPILLNSFVINIGT